MRFIYILLVLFLAMSCRTKKKIEYEYQKQDKTEQITSSKKDSTNIIKKADVIENENLKSLTITTTKTEFEIVTDSVSGAIKSVPKTTTTTIKTSVTETKTKEDNSTTQVSSVNKEDNSATKNDIKIEEKKDEKKTFNNTAIAKVFYLLVALIVGGYIIVKKYFPSIFVKVKKLLTL